jgi:hypothetical protein
MKRIVFALMLMLIMTTLPVLEAQLGTGTFTFTLEGYTVQGQLANAMIHRGNIVTASMVVDDTLQTSMGGVPITGTGDWNGTVNGATLSGTVANVSGTVRACIFLFFCGQADYVGNGTWTGTITGSQGSGTFRGTITFTRSSFSQIPINHPIPISGSWDSSFQTSN